MVPEPTTESPYPVIEEDDRKPLGWLFQHVTDPLPADLTASEYRRHALDLISKADVANGKGRLLIATAQVLATCALSVDRSDR